MKMSHQSKKRGIELNPGTLVTGKWHNKRYTVIEKLGSGAIGSVYLCDSSGKQVALKISDKSMSMTMEVNVLKSLQKVQGSSLGPYLVDVDDFITSRGQVYSFYVMEYLRGQSLSTFIKHNGSTWVGVFMLQLLDDLADLHKAGWVFGDLKEENLLILHSPPRIRWIDVGGTTQIGRAIKEYTEFYDRGYWGIGSRRAEPSYDLFALVMVFVKLYYPNQFERGNNAEVTILSKVRNVAPLRPYLPCFEKAIQGKYQSSAEMKQDVEQILKRPKPSMTRKRSNQKASLLVESTGISLIALFYYIVSLFLP
ncbi:protein kinase domain-containing protein [Virgibacillus necropolis]|uniref:Serine/threonine protein kinase n=1 Tax=Virgibacillus necropolis TaxID=163877 RepID=A0A221M7U6_9BACI|nr:protein kinase [Virgibacillus necropolis]ASN03723.1 serine/threonine protein kinase [Virgibacillus necropolis]